MYSFCVRSSLVLFVTLSWLCLVQADFFKTLERKFYRLEAEQVEQVDIQPWKELSPAVRHMAVQVPMSLISPQENQKAHQGSRILTDGFKWKSCGPADQLVDIHNLTIKPSPLFFPGNLDFGFDIVFHDNIPQSAQVTASLLLQFQQRSGGQWIKIPCIGEIGSCTYDDLCTLSQIIQCPPELQQRGIPCTCPFNKGEYKLPSYSVEIDASVFPSGNYQAQATIKDASKGQIACYQVWFTVG